MSYLQHYGVLGMKWGQRRARKLTEKASKTSDKAKARMYRGMAKAIETKHRKLGGDAYDYTKAQSVGKAYLKSQLFTTYGALKYNEARAQGATRTEAVGRGLVEGFANGLTYGVRGIVRPRIEARSRQ